MPRSVSILVVGLALGLLGSCSGGGDGATATTNQVNPLDAKAEVRDPNADFGWDRTDSDPAVLAALQQAAQAVAGTEINCIDPTETPIETVKFNFDLTHLPVPAATLTCTSIEDEDLTFEGFLDEHAKNVFLEAKQELICARGMQAGTNPATGKSNWPGLPYVDGGTWIIEPDGNDTRDSIATGIGAAAHNMCTDIASDPAPGPQLG